MPDFPYLRLGVNIDHVATIRNARGGVHPEPLKAAFLAVEAGADGITAHLREDRRHISDEDIVRLKNELTKPLNLEMATTTEMLAIATKHKPHACCLVPERREELTTEGGLEVAGNQDYLEDYIARLQAAGSRVSLFVDPDERQIEAAAMIGSDIVELHTGTYCEAVNVDDAAKRAAEFERIKRAAELASQAGIEVHAGHGLTYDSVEAVAALPQIVELNIGHFIVGEAIFVGLDQSIKQMRNFMDKARQKAVNEAS